MPTCTMKLSLELYWMKMVVFAWNKPLRFMVILLKRVTFGAALISTSQVWSSAKEHTNRQSVKHGTV